MNPRFPRQILIYATLFLLSCGASQARIGENYDELVARYGKPSMDIPTTEGIRSLLFEKDGFFISFELIDNKAEKLNLVCKSKEKTTLSEHDVKALLDKNIGINKNAEWKKSTRTEETQFYYLKYGDGTRARWRFDEGSLEIITTKGESAIEAIRVNKANQKLKAF
jgi:hypothetical protein